MWAVTNQTRYAAQRTWVHEEQRSNLTGVIIKPEEAPLMMVWQTSLVVRATEVDYLDAAVIAEKPFLQ